MTFRITAELSGETMPKPKPSLKLGIMRLTVDHAVQEDDSESREPTIVSPISHSSRVVKFAACFGLCWGCFGFWLVVVFCCCFWFLGAKLTTFLCFTSFARMYISGPLPHGRRGQLASKKNQAALDSPSPTVALSLDLSKAFERVNPYWILQVLRRRGAPVWMCNYARYVLFGRAVRHKVQGRLLRPRPILVGVDMGRSFSVLLFCCHGPNPMLVEQYFRGYHCTGLC